MTDRDVNRTLAVFAGIAALAGPRRTRPLAGFLYGALLSRAQGASRRRLEATILSLFDQRSSATQRLDDVDRRIDELVARFGAILPRTAIIERALGPDVLLTAHARIIELGPVREEGKLNFTADTRARLDPRRWPGLATFPPARQDPSPPRRDRTIDEAKRAYVRGEIDMDELEATIDRQVVKRQPRDPTNPGH